MAALSQPGATRPLSGFSFQNSIFAFHSMQPLRCAKRYPLLQPPGSDIKSTAMSEKKSEFNVVRRLIELLLIGPTLPERRKVLKTLGGLRPEEGESVIAECRAVARDRSIKEARPVKSKGK